MIIKESETPVAALHAKADRDGDALLTVSFSGSDHKYDAWETNMDAGDALIVIGNLIEKFGLSAEAVVGRQASVCATCQ